MNKPIIAGICSAIAALIIAIAVQGIANQRPTPVSVMPDFNFGAAGDWGCTSEARNTVNNMIANDVELVLALGDYPYNKTADCWLKIVDPIDEKMKIAIGNHDTNYDYVLNQIMDHFNLSKQYYSFNYHNIHFTVISTQAPWENGSEQYIFVQNDLSNAAQDPTIDWFVVYYHKLAYTSPSHLKSIPLLRDTYHPLFDEYGVDIVLQGHQHNYQRSYPLRYNSDDPSHPIIMDNQTNNYVNPDGSIFITVGTAGHSIHDFSGKAYYIVTQHRGYGFLNIDVRNNATKFIGTLYFNDGTVKDQFSITKSSKHE